MRAIVDGAPPRLLGLTQSSFDPASRVRFIQFMPSLAAAGWQIEHRPNRPDRQWRSPLRPRPLRGVHYRSGRALMKLNRLRDVRAAAHFDAVFVNRDLAGGSSGRFERLLLASNPRVIFDFDDAIFVGPNAGVVELMCRGAAWVTPGNPYLAEYAERFNRNVTVVPTVIDTDEYAPRDWTVLPVRPRIGWSGSDQSIRTTLFPYLDLLKELQAQLDFQLVIVSNTRPELPVAGVDWHFVPWSPTMEGRLGELMDIGIMPLVDDEFQRGKCGMKLLQYMAAGLPTVASPVGVNRDITAHGETGFLATSHGEWRDALLALVRSHELRTKQGTAGRRRCETSWSIRRWMPELLRILEAVSGRQVTGIPTATRDPAVVA